MSKHVYLFEESRATKDSVLKLGNKGAQLAEMTSIGLPVPPGFTITTEACNKFYEMGKKWPEGLEQEIRGKLSAVEKKMGKRFGNPDDPLLFSVRSGSYVSMPGMMDTVLNLGLNDKAAEGMARQTGNERAAYDSYRRFIQMFGDVVMEVPHKHFEDVLVKQKETRGVEYDTDLDVDDLKKVIGGYKKLIQEKTGKSFPADAFEQLKMSINAVFDSWNNNRAIAYRRINKLRNDAGTGVNVQVMVFGNMGDDSGTGVAFTRNPATGIKEHYGEYLINAQGEDVVAGIRTPQPIDTLKKLMPRVYQELAEVYDKLEKHYKDMQDFEFTIERGKLYLLQTRGAKRTGQSAVRCAVDMVKEKLITAKEAILQVKPELLDQLLHKQIDQVAKKEARIIAKGLPASPGAAVGRVYFTADEAVKKAEEGEPVILVRTETSPEDIQGMNAAQGILTSRGGMTSHAAVVARGMGKCCIAGCGDIRIDERAQKFHVKDLIVKEGDFISLDGSSGEVILGKIPVTDPEICGEFSELMKWADEQRKLGVRANADTPHDSRVAREFGAEGIGLCRTEHMFFEGDRITAVREMIIAENEEGRRKALDKLLPMQKGDFKEIFTVMAGLPVTIRLLDPPLHEFLPQDKAGVEALAGELGISAVKLQHKINDLHEFNPMLGHRGCRLAITYPEIAEMQVRAIFEAACELKRGGLNVEPEVMVPLVGEVKEFQILKELIVRVAKSVMDEQGAKVKYKVGTMIEVPRAALTADKIAEVAEFFSFGTNDLTQMTYAYSRDDIGKFLPEYTDKGILPQDPFAVIDQEGVGQLVRIGVDKGRSANDKLKIGICGEHGGEPSSVEFCHRAGLNYVSCSPFRVPIARLAAAQAAVRQ
ncbi:MAG: pyruvate, phosphate dikinase [archaeon]